MTRLTAELRDQLRQAVSERARERAKEYGSHVRLEDEQGAPATICDLELLVALGRLNKDQREAWVDRMILGHTFTAIGRRMGISRERVRQLEHAATKKLTNDMPPDSPFVQRWLPTEDA